MKKIKHISIRLLLASMIVVLLVGSIAYNQAYQETQLNPNYNPDQPNKDDNSRLVIKPQTVLLGVMIFYIFIALAIILYYRVWCELNIGKNVGEIIKK